MIRKLFIIASSIFALGILLVACVPETCPGECDRHEYIAESYELEAWSTEAPFQKIDTVKGDFYLNIQPIKFRLISQAEKASDSYSFFTSCYADECEKYWLRLRGAKPEYSLEFDKAIQIDLSSGKDTLLSAQTDLYQFSSKFGDKITGFLSNSIAPRIPSSSPLFPPEPPTKKFIRARMTAGDTCYSFRVRMSRIKMEQGSFTIRFTDHHPYLKTSASLTLTHMPE